MTRRRAQIIYWTVMSAGLLLAVAAVVYFYRNY
jgi:hypothetical protein